MQRSSRFHPRGQLERREVCRGLCATRTPCRLRGRVDHVSVVSGLKWKREYKIEYLRCH